MSRITLTAASRVGCIRSNNEDMVLVLNQKIRSDAYATEFDTTILDRFMVAVADGMGGHQAGEVASEETLENLKFYIHDLPRGMSESELIEAMVSWQHSMNHTLNSRGLSDSSKANMGTTLVGLLYYEGHYFSINCGDSRLYRLHMGQLTQLTTDHSLNMVTGQERHSNVITNCIGGGCKHPYIDMVDITEKCLSGDILMLCSDGLNDMIDDIDIEQLLTDGATGNQLCEAAIEAGGFDNVSAVVLKIED